MTLTWKCWTLIWVLPVTEHVQFFFERTTIRIYFRFCWDIYCNCNAIHLSGTGPRLTGYMSGVPFSLPVRRPASRDIPRPTRNSIRRKKKQSERLGTRLPFSSNAFENLLGRLLNDKRVQGVNLFNMQKFGL